MTVIRQLEGHPEEVALAPADGDHAGVLGAGDRGEGDDSGVESVDGEVILGRVDVP